ncbi:preprotein translocase subunit YajC [Streptococcus catagoni]|uniref:preprotein translocase subunit YajC n=1 Tax=Streptococcus catagoni TaxID=2654874 RepID=UPI001408BE8A|nr:preprotein translocase subunit YajC [Streptococcus catagoni]
MGLSTILMFVVMIGLIFFMQRQQKKQAQERQNQLNTLQKGDEIVTIGGMYALVDEVDKEANRVVLDVDGVFLPFELSAIKRVITSTGAPTNPVVDETMPEAESIPVVEETAVEPTKVADTDVEAETAIEAQEEKDGAISSN